MEITRNFLGPFYSTLYFLFADYGDFHLFVVSAETSEIPIIENPHHSALKECRLVAKKELLSLIELVF